MGRPETLRLLLTREAALLLWLLLDALLFVSVPGCVDKKRVCAAWARLGFCERRRTFMRKNCPQRCHLCFGGSRPLPTLSSLCLRFNTRFLFFRASGSCCHANASQR